MLGLKTGPKLTSVPTVAQAGHLRKPAEGDTGKRPPEARVCQLPVTVSALPWQGATVPSAFCQLRHRA